MSSGQSLYCNQDRKLLTQKGCHLLYMYNQGIITTCLSNVETMHANWWIPLASSKTPAFTILGLHHSGHAETSCQTAAE